MGCVPREQQGRVGVAQGVRAKVRKTGAPEQRLQVAVHAVLRFERRADGGREGELESSWCAARSFPDRGSEALRGDPRSSGTPAMQDPVYVLFRERLPSRYLVDTVLFRSRRCVDSPGGRVNGLEEDR
jgi:hypothetical protein